MDEGGEMMVGMQQWADYGGSINFMRALLYNPKSDLYVCVFVCLCVRARVCVRRSAGIYVSHGRTVHSVCGGGGGAAIYDPDMCGLADGAGAKRAAGTAATRRRVKLDMESNGDDSDMTFCVFCCVRLTIFISVI